MTRAVALAEGTLLAKVAAAAVGARLTGVVPEPVDLPPVLTEPGASFVTLERQGVLRGCVGTLEAIRPLYDDVQHNAVRAMRDPRLPAVTLDDWPDLDVKVSVLSAPEPLAVAGRDDLLAVVRPGVDGLIISDGQRRATFLPAVWAKLPEPARFLDALLAKAGLTAWPDGLDVRRYESVEFRDPAPRARLVV
jgi:uncharacterized protein